MNKESHVYTNPNAQNRFTMSRTRLTYCRIILITSLFWVLVDAFVILYLTDCSSYRLAQQQPCDQNKVSPNEIDLVNEQNKLNRKQETPAAGELKIEKKEPDYEDELSKKNKRLQKIHKMKQLEKEKQTEKLAYREYNSARYIGTSEKPDDRTNFINKIKNLWFKEEKANEPTNPTNWPGENGRGVVMPENLKPEADRRFKENQFNILASDLIALNRSVPDQRSEACKNREYRVELPTTSIIIVYHNEGNSTLLRGLMSIVRKTPARYLKEIILVDDASEGREYLHDPLDKFVATLPIPVKIFRNKERLGLMRSRLRGAEAATGDTMTFLDAHIEATDGWLPPLLSEIKMNRKTVVCPVIDVISDDTFEYLTGSEFTYGGFDSHFVFDWIAVPDRENSRRNYDRSLPVRETVASPIIDVISDENFAYLTGSETTYGGFNEKLNFRWYPIPEREVKRRNYDRSLPARTPTMAGGLFTIDRSYFYELGAYDEGMDIWGAENLEMSFRIWMCGGILLIVPCSHVGHVFRKQTPYSFPGGTNRVIFRNNRRLVDVWTDEYSKYFHRMIPDLNNIEAGDLTKRIELRKSLNCKSFKWYLENIYPEAPIPINFYHVGVISNVGLNFCLDTMSRKDGEDAGASYCHGQGGNQLFEYSKTHQLAAGSLCLDTLGNPGVVKLKNCNKIFPSQQWEYDSKNNLFRNKQNSACLGINETNNNVLITVNCDEKNQSLKWVFKDPIFDSPSS